MASSKHFFLLALFIFLSSFAPSCAHNKTRPGSSRSQTSYKDCFPRVYAFGDSYTDTGNAYLSGGLKSFIGAVVSHLPFGFASFNNQKGRLCDGRLVVDYLCEALSHPYLTPYKENSADLSKGANFAIAGSTGLPSDLFLRKQIPRTLMWQTVPRNFQTQIDWFNKYRQGVGCKGMDQNSCKAEMQKALYWIGGVGFNDYARTFGSSISARTVTETSVGNVCKLIQTLLDSGAKYMVVQGLPPMGCLPLNLVVSPSHDRDNLGCAASANSVIKAHNDLLQRKLLEFQKKYRSCTIVYADYWNAYRTVLANATSYQFQEPFKACCGAGGGDLNFVVNSICGAPGTTTCNDPSKHISWDGVHLSDAMHQHISDLLFNQGYCKPSFDQLIRKAKRG